MGMHECVDDIREQAGSTLVPSSEAPPTAPSMIDRAGEPTKKAMAAIEALKIEAPNADTPRIALSGISAIPRFTPLPREELKADIRTDNHVEAEPEVAAAAREIPDAPAEAEPRRRISPFTVMVASLAGAAGFGAMLGAVIAVGIAKSTPVASITPPKFGLEELNALKEQVVQARVELAALKTNIDSGHRSASQQFTRIGERVERIERTQAEPVSKLTKAVESLDRMRRAEAGAHTDVTGSITPPQSVAKPGVVDGWILRDVHRGTAYIEGRIGLIEVDQGDMVPGLGRVDAIRKQDGRWVVVTSKGLIVSPR
jgi:hypothetical protein